MSEVLTTARERLVYAGKGARELARRLKDDAGQTAAEYMGVLLVVSVIIAAVSTTGIGGEIKQKMTHMVRVIAVGKTDKQGGDSGNANSQGDRGNQGGG